MESPGRRTPDARRPADRKRALQMTWDQFWRGQSRPAAAVGGRRIVDVFNDVREEYRALRESVAVVDRSFRARIEVTGADRLAWLNNFTTNQIKTLRPGDGHYGFALNGAGRIQFDLNALVRDDRIWIELDERFVERALAHLGKYIIMEDVRLSPLRAEYVHVGLAGPESADLLLRLGAEAPAAVALQQSAELYWGGQAIAFFRSDFCGVRGFEVFAPADLAVGLWQTLTEGGVARAAACGRTAVEVCRIESGLPDGVADLADDVLPAESGQLDRAVSFNKGCYLGQEIVERMRSRGSVARRLVGIKLEAGAEVPTVGMSVCGADGQDVGRLTSACASVALDAPIGLAILKSAHAEAGNRVLVAADSRTVEAQVCRLPFVEPA